jgi:hypothetical protein
MGFKKTVGLFVLSLSWTFAGSLHETVSSQPGFAQFYNLEYDRALAIFQEEAAHQPSSPGPDNHIAQTVLYRQMYHAGMLSSDFFSGMKLLHQPKLPLSDADETLFHDSLNRAMSLCQEKLTANPNDTDALYALGVSYGLRANYDFIVKRAWMDALKDASEARKLHRHVTELDPDFIDAKLTQGVYDYVVGSLPLHWRLLGFLGGFHGNKKRGIRTLAEVGEQGRRNRVDALVLLAAIDLREKEPDQAIPVLTELTQSFPANPLLQVELKKAQEESK